jgi:hypothetical protein
MAETRKIQCPSCGSNSTYKLFDGSYKCNYCQGSFMVNEQQQQQQQRPAPVNRPLGNLPSAGSKKMIIAAVAVFVILMMVMAGFIFTKTITSDGAPGITTWVQDKQAARIVKTMAFAGTAGSAIWVITERSCSADSLCYELQVVDPQSNAVKGKRIIGAPFLRYQVPGIDRVLGNRFWKFGDLAYTISNDTVLTAYDIYSGKPVLTTSSISAKIPGPASGILKVEYSSPDMTFKVTTTSGDVLSFDPLLQAFVQAAKPKGKKEDVVTKELYLSDGLKHNLYLFTKRGDGFPIVFGDYAQEARLPGPDAPKTNNVKDVFGNIHIEKVSEKNYFRAQLLLRDPQGNLLLLYKTDLKENSPVILESVNKEGKANWSLQDTMFLNIGKAFSSEDLGCEYTCSDNLLIINVNREETYYVAIDVNTGKILWSFHPKEYLAQHAS